MNHGFLGPSSFPIQNNLEVNPPYVFQNQNINILPNIYSGQPSPFQNFPHAKPYEIKKARAQAAHARDKMLINKGIFNPHLNENCPQSNIINANPFQPPIHFQKNIPHNLNTINQLNHITKKNPSQNFQKKYTPQNINNFLNQDPKHIQYVDNNIYKDQAYNISNFPPKLNSNYPHGYSQYSLFPNELPNYYPQNNNDFNDQRNNEILEKVSPIVDFIHYPQRDNPSSCDQAHSLPSDQESNNNPQLAPNDFIPNSPENQSNPLNQPHTLLPDKNSNINPNLVTNDFFPKAPENQSSPLNQPQTLQPGEDSKNKADLVSNNFFPKIAENRLNPLKENENLFANKSNYEELKQEVIIEMANRNFVSPQNYPKEIKDKDIQKMIDYMDIYLQMNCQIKIEPENSQYTITPDFLEANKLKNQFPEKIKMNFLSTKLDFEKEPRISQKKLSNKKSIN